MEGDDGGEWLIKWFSPLVTNFSFLEKERLIVTQVISLLA